MIWYAEDLGEEYLKVSVLCLTLANCAVLQYVFKCRLSYQMMMYSDFLIQDSPYN